MGSQFWHRLRGEDSNVDIDVVADIVREAGLNYVLH